MMHMLFWAVICGLLPLILIIYWKLKTLRKRKKVERVNNKTFMLVVLGSGGHTMEMMKLLSKLGDHYSPRIYVKAKTDRTSEEKVLELEGLEERNKSYWIYNIPRSREVKQSWLSSILSTVYSVIYSIPLVFKMQPDLILCNGPGTCIPVMFSGILVKFLGIHDVKMVYVESICRVETLSLSARLLYYFIDDLIVQWPQLKTKYPKTKFLGRLV